MKTPGFIKSFVVAISVTALLYSCNTAEKSPEIRTPLKDKVISAEEQKALTPDIVLKSLKEGNRRFMGNDLTKRDHSALVRDAALGQYPKAVILSCLDSRVTVEDIFDEGIGDLFVCREIGRAHV